MHILELKQWKHKIDVCILDVLWSVETFYVHVKIVYSDLTDGNISWPNQRFLRCKLNDSHLPY